MAQTEIHLAIEGMTCGHCERAVSGAIRSLDGVTSVQVDHKSGLGTVIINSALVAPAQIIEAIENTGLYHGRIIAS